METVKNENMVVVTTDKTITPEVLQGDYLIDFVGMEKKYGLSHNQILGAFLMGTSRISKVKLAEQLGVSRQTIYNWLMNRNFTNVYNQFCSAVLMGMKGTAVLVMEDLLDDDDARVQFQASKFVQESTQYIELAIDEDEGDAITDLIDFFVKDPKENNTIQIDTTESEYDYSDDIIDPSEVL